jgi:hypothetical protein
MKVCQKDREREPGSLSNQQSLDSRIGESEERESPERPGERQNCRPPRLFFIFFKIFFYILRCLVCPEVTNVPGVPLGSLCVSKNLLTKKIRLVNFC